MTVLIAAAGDDGRAARDALSDAGFDVERVATLAAASARVAPARVAVVGALEDGSARELRAAARSTPPGGPALVHLGDDDAFETCVPLPVEDDELLHAVRLAREAVAYRDEVDALYERCRERANGDDDPETAGEVERAKRRAGQALHDARRVAGRTPYEQLFVDVEAGSDRTGGGASSGRAAEGADSNGTDERASSSRAEEGTGAVDEADDLDDGTDDAREPGDTGGGDR